MVEGNIKMKSIFEKARIKIEKMKMKIFNL